MRIRAFQVQNFQDFLTEKKKISQKSSSSMHVNVSFKSNFIITGYDDRLIE